MNSVTLKIQGMSCGHCVSSVSKGLNGLDGIVDAKVTIGSAEVTFDPAKASVDQMKAAVEAEGYDVVGTNATTVSETSCCSTTPAQSTTNSCCGTTAPAAQSSSCCG